MLNQIQEQLGVFQNFIWFVLISLMVLSVVMMIGLKYLELGNFLVSWYGIVVRKRRWKLFGTALLLLRMLYEISFTFRMNGISLAHFLVFLMLHVLVFLTILRVKYLFYDVVCCGGMVGYIYLQQLLSAELTKAQVSAGMYILRVGNVIFLIGVSLCQFFIGLRFLLGNHTTDLVADKKLRSLSIMIIPFLFLQFFVPYYAILNTEYLPMEGEVYQMVNGEKVSYPEKSKIYRTDSGCQIEAQNGNYVLDASMLYLDGQEKVMVTSTISIVQPKLQLNNKVSPMTYLSWENGSFEAINGRKKTNLQDFFFFDGKDTYYFPESTRISWQDKEVYISSFCQVVVTYNNSVEIYDLSKDTYTKYETGNGYVIATMQGKEQVNLSTDILYRENGQEQMLFLQPNLLDELE